MLVRLFVRPTAVVNGLKAILLLWCLNENRLFQIKVGISNGISEEREKDLYKSHLVK